MVWQNSDKKHLRSDYFRTKSSTINTLANVKGFIGVMVFLVPLFIICLSTAMALVFCIRNYNHTQSICLHLALNTQSALAKKINLLLALNNQVKNLRAQYIKTKAQLIAIESTIILSMDVITISSLKAKLVLLKSQMQALTIKQKKILSQSFITLEKHFNQFKKQIKKYTKRLHKTHHRPFPLALKAKPPKGVVNFLGSPPTYHLKPNFLFQQSLSFSWEFLLHKFLPNWISRHYFLNQKSRYQCSATLYKEKNNNLQPRLIKLVKDRG